MGCSDGPTVDDAIVKAVSTENAKLKAKEAMEAKALAIAKEKKAAAEAAQAAIDAAIDAAAVQPPVAPESLDAACEGVLTAYDSFMKSGPEKDALLWSDGRRRKMGERRTACLKVGSIPVAACEAHALTNAPTSLGPQPRKDAARLLMERCHDKFGGAG
ncbi:MAG: hypothetical protein AAF721_36145 [Myxococcota bacterium]